MDSSKEKSLSTEGAKFYCLESPQVPSLSCAALLFCRPWAPQSWPFFYNNRSGKELDEYRFLFSVVDDLDPFDLCTSWNFFCECNCLFDGVSGSGLTGAFLCPERKSMPAHEAISPFPGGGIDPRRYNVPRSGGLFFRWCYPLATNVRKRSA